MGRHAEPAAGFLDQILVHLDELRIARIEGDRFPVGVVVEERGAVGVVRPLEELLELGLLPLQATRLQRLLVDHDAGRVHAVAEEGGAEQLRGPGPAQRLRGISDHVDADRPLAEPAQVEHVLRGEDGLGAAAAGAKQIRSVADLVVEIACFDRVAIGIVFVVRRATDQDALGMDRPYGHGPAELVGLDLGIAIAPAQRPVHQGFAELER